MILAARYRLEKFKMTLYVAVWSLNYAIFSSFYLFLSLSAVHPPTKDCMQNYLDDLKKNPTIAKPNTIYKSNFYS